MIPEKNTEEYTGYLEEIINELMGIKNSLKRGQLRKENRKEVSMLQNAISALRHLRNKNNRQVVLLNNRDKSLNENFNSDHTRDFLMGRNQESSCERINESFTYDDIRNFLSGINVYDDQ